MDVSDARTHNIKKIMEATRCSFDQAEIALHDASNNVAAAVDNIFEGSNLDTWSHQKRKGPKDKAAAEVKVEKRSNNRPPRRPLPPRQPQNAAATFNGGSGGGGGGKKPTGGFKTGGAAGEHETQGADKGEDLWTGAQGPLIFNRREKSPESAPAPTLQQQQPQQPQQQQSQPQQVQQAPPQAAPAVEEHKQESRPLSFADIVRKKPKGSTPPPPPPPPPPQPQPQPQAELTDLVSSQNAVENALASTHIGAESAHIHEQPAAAAAAVDEAPTVAEPQAPKPVVQWMNNATPDASSRYSFVYESTSAAHSSVAPHANVHQQQQQQHVPLQQQSNVSLPLQQLFNNVSSHQNVTPHHNITSPDWAPTQQAETIPKLAETARDENSLLGGGGGGMNDNAAQQRGGGGASAGNTFAVFNQYTASQQQPPPGFGHASLGSTYQPQQSYQPQQTYQPPQSSQHQLPYNMHAGLPYQMYSRVPPPGIRDDLNGTALMQYAFNINQMDLNTMSFLPPQMTAASNKPMQNQQHHQNSHVQQQSMQHSQTSHSQQQGGHQQQQPSRVDHFSDKFIQSPVPPQPYMNFPYMIPNSAQHKSK